MSKEQDFHKLIEQQDSESKERVWKRIESQIEEETEEVVSNSDNTLSLSKCRLLNQKNIIIVCLVLLFAIVMTIIIVNILPKNNGGDNDFRYCNEEDYYIEDSDINLAQYAEQENLNFLYFDWYDQIGYFEEKQYKLNGTDEVVCLYEELIDINGMFLSFYITDDKTQIDFLKEFTDICTESTTINSVEVKWAFDGMDGHAMFIYQGFSYYLNAKQVFEQNYVLDLVESLLA